MTRIHIREEDADILLAHLWAENDKRLRRDDTMSDQDIIRTLKRAGFSTRHNIPLPYGAREITATRPDGAQVVITTPTVYLHPDEWDADTMADIKVRGQRTQRWWGLTDILDKVQSI